MKTAIFDVEKNTKRVILIGKHNSLNILRHTSVGLYLGDDSGEDVLLPNKYCPKDYEIGDELKVFVYKDYAGRKVATNLVPKILLNDFEVLEVTATSDVGAFMNWGMEKELMVPHSEQNPKMEIGGKYLVYLALDSKTDRLYASNRLEQFLQNEFMDLEIGQEVSLIVYRRTPLGHSLIVNESHLGFVFENEVFKKFVPGKKCPGYVKKIHEDGKIDIALEPIGFLDAVDVQSKKIYKELIENEGFLPYNDKSTPEEISVRFGLSKKAFKKAIGQLYKAKKITILKEGIRSIHVPPKKK